MTNDSSRTERRIWRRDAPIVRSVANSRVRCAIVIESELAITNAPTKSAMKPNESRNVCRKLVKAFVSLASVSACSTPLRTWVCCGRIERIEASSAASLTFAFLETRIWSSFPSFLNRRCAVSRLNPESVAPPMSSPLEPNRTRPATLNGVAAPCASILIWSPTSMCFLRAVERSMTTSPFDGHSPSTSVSELNLAWLGSTEKPRWGAPPKLITFPFCPIRLAIPATPPIAACTWGSCFTFGSSDSSKGGRSCVASTLTADFPVIDASVPT